MLIIVQESSSKEPRAILPHRKDQQNSAAKSNSVLPVSHVATTTLNISHVPKNTNGHSSRHSSSNVVSTGTINDTCSNNSSILPAPFVRVCCAGNTFTTTPAISNLTTPCNQNNAAYASITVTTATSNTFRNNITNASHNISPGVGVVLSTNSCYGSGSSSSSVRCVVSSSACVTPPYTPSPTMTAATCPQQSVTTLVLPPSSSIPSSNISTATYPQIHVSI